MVAGGLTEKVKADRSMSFYFYSCGTIPPPVIMVQVSTRVYFKLILVLYDLKPSNFYQDNHIELFYLPHVFKQSHKQK